MAKKNIITEFNNAWKGRGNLANLVKELQRQKESRVDFVADTRTMTVATAEGGLYLRPTTPQTEEWLPSEGCLFKTGAYSQVLEKCTPSVPKRFGDALLETNAGRLVELINGLNADSPDKRLVRCLDGQVRGYLSSKYRILDNYDIAFSALDVAKRVGAQVFEAGLSDTNMRIKFTSQSVWDKIDSVQRSSPQGGWYAGAIGNKELQGKQVLGATIKGELPGGPGTVHPVVTISNSETGHGGFHVRLGILMGICFNIATMEEIISQVHLGGELETGIFSAETIAADSQVVMKKAADAMLAAFDQDKFRALIQKARNSQVQAIEHPTAAVDHLVESNLINGEQKEALLEYFLKDYDTTAFGLAQAVSRLAQDTDDSDLSNELELTAGKIINKPSLVLV